MAETITEDMIMKASRQRQQIKCLLKLNHNFRCSKESNKEIHQQISHILTHVMVASLRIKDIFSSTLMVQDLFSVNQEQDHQVRQSESTSRNIVQIQIKT